MKELLKSYIQQLDDANDKADYENLGNMEMAIKELVRAVDYISDVLELLVNALPEDESE